MSVQEAQEFRAPIEFDAFTLSARNSLVYAKLATSNADHDVVLPEHLLIGCLREVGQRGFAPFEMPLDDAYDRLIRKGPVEYPEPVYGDAVVSILARARQLHAEQHGSTRDLEPLGAANVSTDYIFAALVEDPRSEVLAEFFAKHGITAERVETWLKEKYAPKPHAPAPRRTESEGAPGMAL